MTCSDGTQLPTLGPNNGPGSWTTPYTNGTNTWSGRAGLWNDNLFGNGGTGGNPYTDTCPDKQVLVGYAGNSGAYVTSFYGVCGYDPDNYCTYNTGDPSCKKAPPPSSSGGSSSPPPSSSGGSPPATGFSTTTFTTTDMYLLLFVVAVGVALFLWKKKKSGANMQGPPQQGYPPMQQFGPPPQGYPPNYPPQQMQQFGPPQGYHPQ
jgi:hypothetical protein